MLIGRFLLRRRPSGTPSRTKVPPPVPPAGRSATYAHVTYGSVDYGGRVVTDLSASTVKPHLRGWLHLGTFPLAVVAGALLTLRAPAGQHRAAVGVFGVSAALLFGVSALYHRGQWGPRAMAVLKRLDH